MKKIDRSNLVRDIHQAKWDEPIIFEMSVPGERGILVAKDAEIAEQESHILANIPDSLKRKKNPALPEVAQHRVLRHYDRLSQETLGADLNLEIGQGTCTMKYSPKINEVLTRSSKFADLHPEQDAETVQGILEIIDKADKAMQEISGMDRFTFQAGGGSQAIFTIASLVRAYHEYRGEGEQRDEIITTVYSHPSDAAAPHVAGYKVKYIFPDEEGYPDFEAFQAAISNHTAAFFVANPEDTGVYNKNILKFTKLAHEYGVLCCYDQANANGLLGVTRAKEAGFDACFFNLHKTFSAPHGSGGPACGAVGVSKELEKFLPTPVLAQDGEKYYLDYDRPYSIGKVRSYQGATQVVLKTYAWIRSLGAEGLYEVAKIAVLNNNYLFQKLMATKGIDAPYIQGKQRVEQVRYSLEKLYQDTGVGTADVQRRMMDFATHYWASHHPYYVPEPMTLEPTETPSKADLDEYIATLQQVIGEAYADPEHFKNAPFCSVCHKIDNSCMDDPQQWAITWRAYQKKFR